MGITKRVDDLGRVVIPKEIRENLGIKEGTPMEITVNEDGNIILKKRSKSVCVNVEGINVRDIISYMSKN